MKRENAMIECEEILLVELMVVITKYEDVMVAHEEAFPVKFIVTKEKFIVTKELDKGFMN